MGVDLFFVISGYIIAASVQRLPESNKSFHFFVNRFSRVAPYYYLITIFYAGFLLVFTGTCNFVLLAKSLSFVPLKGDPFLFMGWTLIHELFFYIFITIALFFSQSLLKITFWYLLFLSAMHFIPDYFHLITFLKASINYTFIFGMLAYLYKDKLTFIFRNPYIAFCAVTVFVLAYIFTSDNPINNLQLKMIPTKGYYFRDVSFIYHVNQGFSRVFLLGVPSALLFITVLSMEYRLKKLGNSVFVKIGDASYSIYLIQVIPIFFINFYKILNIYLLSGIFLATIAVSCYLFKVEGILSKFVKNKLLILAQKAGILQ